MHRRSNGRTSPDGQPSPTPKPSSAQVDGRRERLHRLDATRKALLLRQCVSGRARNALSPRYDLRRRVLETNLKRECQPECRQSRELALPTALKPAQPTPPRSLRRWGYCHASNKAGNAMQARNHQLEQRLQDLHKSPASGSADPTSRLVTHARRPQPASPLLHPAKRGAQLTATPRKLGSPRNFAVASAAAIKKRLRRSWSYREAIAGDAPTDEQLEEQSPKRLRTEPLESAAEAATSKGQQSAAATITRPVLAKRSCRVQHGKPFAIPTPPIIIQEAPRGTLFPQHSTQGSSTSCATSISPAMGQCFTKFTGASSAPCTRSPTGPHGTWKISSICQNVQGGIVTPMVSPYHHCIEAIVPLSPSVVTQGTQTSPKRLRRRSSLKRAFERLFSSGKENETNTSRDSVSKNAKAKVKRRPSLVESLLLRRNGNSMESQAKPCRRSTECVGVLKDVVGSTPCRKKARRAHSLQLKAPEFDPWG
ncbi:uncharacterized protein LOC119180054 [Rhipicephalus microplus]|uniref:uncharacterized protein LOC119180054 n=1 Tax=Rhipicephalus microplus TaxID=6941 RepID=UPI003F6AB84D